ncbi:MAG: single-stranded-DNA-specific exonuclease RecJ [Nitrospirota bacterium]|nr:single-stranded-DNA-specific exonuclease RecJ [Nitrospirota bacterium]
MGPQPQEQPLKYRWEIPAIDPEKRRALREVLGLSRISAQVLLNRGVGTPEAAGRFLDPASGTLHDPYLFRDMTRAVERLDRALEAGEPIAVYGDYDVDGISGATLLAEFFAGLGHPVRVVIPDRFADGYGLSGDWVERLAADGVTLIVTTDNGTTAHAAVARAVELGVDVIITDHHEVRGALPPAYALLNPHRPDATYPEKRLCGVGVALKLCHGLLVRRGAAQRDQLPPSLLPLLDLVALGTVADMAPLTGENRMLVRAGLQLLSRGERPGVAALKEVAGLTGQRIGAGQVGFHLGPRINAGGRVADAGEGVTLLTTRDPEVARDMARSLDRANQERRRVEARITEEVVERIEAENLGRRNCIVLGSPEWHPGVLGIIASRVVERYHRPSLLIGIGSGGVGKGSGRSIPGLHLFDALGRCEDLLLGYGGHMYAAGITLEMGQVEALGQRLDEVVGRMVKPDAFRLALRLDASARLTEVNRELTGEFERLAPFGPGNPEPLLLLERVVPVRPQVVGNGHLRMTLTRADASGVRLSAMAFGCGDWYDGAVTEGKPVDLVGSVSINHWQGRETLQFRVRDLRPVPGVVSGGMA